MSLNRVLARELRNRIDCVKTDYERLIAEGIDAASLKRVIRQSLEIGIIKDKLENLRTHELLSTDEENND